MVDQSTLEKIGPLNVELRRIEAALDIFARGGRITSMTVATAMGESMAQSVLIETATMPYPQQMVETITAYLTSREQEIRNELAALGVTGVEAPPRSPPTRTQRRRA